MRITTRDFGELNIDPEEIINIPRGLFAFEEYTRFALIKDEDNPICWLQSLEEAELSFILMNPFLFKKDYEFELADEILLDLGIKDPGEVAVFVLMVIPEDYKKMTANLTAPLVINTKLNRARQIILNEKQYSMRYRLFGEENLSKGAEFDAGLEQKEV